jgi:EAL domain-containing protein (putative c-di-GMP-specific phosphodiesterase class I)
MMATARKRSATHPAADDVPAPRWHTSDHGRTEPPRSPVGSVVHLSGDPGTARRTAQAALRRILGGAGPDVVFQPQLSLSRLALTGYEALARFPDGPLHGPEQWFGLARELGHGAHLEARALQMALAARDRRPAGTTLAINLSPGVLDHPMIAEALPENLSGIEIELTEHEWAPGNARLRRELDSLRERGATVAIDDVGAAHSGLRRVMDLAPDRIKLDRHLVHGVATSRPKAALIRAVVEFAEQIDVTVCAEGVEGLGDLEALADLDVGFAQGWAIGRPNADFTDVDVDAVQVGRDSLSRVLAGGSGAGRAGRREPEEVYGPDPSIDLDELLSRLTRVRSLSELVAVTAQAALALGSDQVAVSLLDAGHQTLRSLPPPGRPREGDDEAFELADYPLTEQCLRLRQVVPLYLGSAGDTPEWELLERLGFATALMVPVVSQRRVIGLLECYRGNAVAWTRREIQSARTAAAMIGPVLDLLLPR